MMTRTTKAALCATALIGALTVSASAQNTADDWKWVVDFSARHDGWDTACDQHKESKDRRCYVRYVDVYAPRPQFGAAFAFVQWGEDGQPFIEFSFERGVRFTGNRFTVTEGGNAVWTYDTAQCAGTRCLLEGAAADALFDELTPGRQLEFRLVDGYGRAWTRQWPVDEFAPALADFREQSAERGLPAN